MTSNASGNPFERLVFPDDPKQFGVWKDLIIGHLRQKSAALRREAMAKGQDEPAFSYEDLLVSSCEVPRPMDTDDEGAMQRYKWQQVILSDQDAYIRSMLNQTMRREYLESLRVSFNDDRLPAAWSRLEVVFGHSNAQGMAALIARFDDALRQDFQSVGELTMRVKEARNRINRQSRESLGGVTMIPNQLAAIKILSLFPSQYWGNQVEYSQGGFHLDKVEALLRNVFMNKSRSEIEAMQAAAVPVNHVTRNRHLGKRKARTDDDLKRKDACYYCEGKYNRDDLPHMKRDCPQMLKDRARGLMRANIFSKGTMVSVSAKPVRVAHVKGAKKAPKKKARAPRLEIPADVAVLQTVNSFKRVAAARARREGSAPCPSDTLTPEQLKADEDELMASPPATPSSPVVSDTVLSDDDDVDEFEPGNFPALAGKVTVASSTIEKASALIEETTPDAATV